MEPAVPGRLASVWKTRLDFSRALTDTLGAAQRSRRLCPHKGDATLSGVGTHVTFILLQLPLRREVVQLPFETPSQPQVAPALGRRDGAVSKPTASKWLSLSLRRVRQSGLRRGNFRLLTVFCNYGTQYCRQTESFVPFQRNIIKYSLRRPCWRRPWKRTVRGAVGGPPAESSFSVCPPRSHAARSPSVPSDLQKRGTPQPLQAASASMDLRTTTECAARSRK